MKSKSNWRALFAYFLSPVHLLPRTFTCLMLSMKYWCLPQKCGVMKLLFIWNELSFPQKWVLYSPDFESLWCTTPGWAWRMIDCCGIQLKAQEMGKKSPLQAPKYPWVTSLNMLQIMNKLSYILYLFLSTKSNQSSFFFRNSIVTLN